MNNIFKVNGKVNIISLIISFLITLGGGIIIGILTKNSSIIYEQITKPKFSPPGYVFGIVWPILYILMSISSYRVYMKLKTENKSSSAILLYIIQLGINFLWPIIFFMFKLYGVSWIILLILIIILSIVIVKFFKIDKLAGILLVPYLIWCIYALYLNISIWILNEM